MPEYRRAVVFSRAVGLLQLPVEQANRRAEGRPGRERAVAPLHALLREEARRRTGYARSKPESAADSVGVLPCPLG